MMFKKKLQPRISFCVRQECRTSYWEPNTFKKIKQMRNGVYIDINNNIATKRKKLLDNRYILLLRWVLLIPKLENLYFEQFDN